MRVMNAILLATVFAFSLSVGYVGGWACAKAPPNLSPVAQQAFQNTRVIKGLDILRDFAIDANGQQPPLLSLATTRKVVSYHESALKTIHALPVGWKAVVTVGLDEVLKNLPSAEVTALMPYVALVKTLLTEVNP